MVETSAPQIHGLAPLCGDHPRWLILGSMPSAKSIAAQQYYAHPQNAFWPIMAHCFDFELSSSYQQNVQALTDHCVAVWDVLSQCRRRGSLDAAIERGSEVLNPIHDFIRDNPSLAVVALNGAAAYNLFKRHSPAAQDTALRIVQLPSSSPAHAAMSRLQKRKAWAKLLALDSHEALKRT